MKSGKANGTSEVGVEMIVASGEVGIKVIIDLCQCALNSRGMPDKLKTSVIVSTFKEKGDVMNRGLYRGVDLLEHTLKIVERVLEKRIRTMSV